jgi:hypothetical protein
MLCSVYKLFDPEQIESPEVKYLWRTSVLCVVPECILSDFLRILNTCLPSFCEIV